MLYFAYNARISPDEMQQVAPNAEFQFIAHLPEWGLEFPITNDTWGGTLPVVKPELRRRAGGRRRRELKRKRERPTLARIPAAHGEGLQALELAIRVDRRA